MPATTTPTIQIGSIVTPIGTIEAPREGSHWHANETIRSGERFEVLSLDAGPFARIQRAFADHGIVLSVQVAYLELW